MNNNGNNNIDTQNPAFPGQPVYYYSQPIPPSPLTQKLKDTAKNTNMLLLGLLALAFGIFESRMIVHGGFGIGAFLVNLGFYACFTPFFFKRGTKNGWSVLLLSAPLLALSASFAFNSSINGRGWMVIALLSMYALHSSLLSGSAAGSPLCADTVTDTLYTHVCAPFAALPTALSGFFSIGKKSDSPFAKILVGILISLPVIVILLISFSCADSVFSSAIENAIDSFNFDDVMEFIGDIFIGVILFLYYFPLVLYMRSGYRRTRQEKQRTGKLDSIICATIIFISSAVYLMFCAFQFKYLFAVQLSYYFNYSFDVSLSLPENMTWSEYARSGFFELSGIIICTFIVVMLIAALAKRDEKGKTPIYLRIALTLISGCNIVLVASAILRMTLYTIWCGLTAKRIGVLAIIAFILASIILLIINIWNEKFRMMPAMLATGVILVTVFGCMNVDAVCARVNVYRHIELGTSIDIDYLGELSTAAAPSVERLMLESEDNDVRLAARGIIAKYHYYGDEYYSSYDKLTFGEMTLDDYRAEQIFQKYRPSKDSVDYYEALASYQTRKREYERYNEDEYYMTFDEYKQAYA